MVDSNTSHDIDNNKTTQDKTWDDFAKSLEKPDQGVSQEEWNEALSVLSRTPVDESSNT